MTISIPQQNIKVDAATGIDPVWYDKFKQLFDAVNALTGAAAPVPTAMTLLETITLAGAASYASSVPWAGYSHIRLLLSNVILSAVGNSLYCELHSNGAYQNVNYLSGAELIGLTGTPVFTPTLTTAIGLYVYGGTDLTVGSIPEGASIDMTIFNVNSTTMHKHMNSTHVVASATQTDLGWATGLWRGGVTPIDGIRFKSSAGTANLNSGLIQIYGIK